MRLSQFNPLRRYQAHVAKITSSGYMEEMNPRVFKIGRRICRLWVFIQLGRLKIVGEENLNLDERIVLIINHPSMTDFPVVLAATRGTYYGVVADNMLRKAAGLPAVFAAKAGVIPVDRTRGATVLDTAATALRKFRRLGLAPEGKVNPTGLGPLKPGVGLILKSVSEKMQDGSKVGVQIMHICYLKPQDERAAKNYWKLGLKYRGGVVATFMPTIYWDEHPNVDELMQVLKERFVALEWASGRT